MKTFGKEFVDSFAFLWVAMSADIASGFVDHPQFGDGFRYLKPKRSESFEVGLDWHKHVFINSFAVNSYQPQFDELLGFSSGAD